MSVTWLKVTTSACEPLEDGARLVRRAAVGLVDGDRRAGVLRDAATKAVLTRLEQLARDVVGDVEERVLGGGGRRAEQERQGRGAEAGTCHRVVSFRIGSIAETAIPAGPGSVGEDGSHASTRRRAGAPMGEGRRRRARPPRQFRLDLAREGMREHEAQRRAGAGAGGRPARGCRPRARASTSVGRTKRRAGPSARARRGSLPRSSSGALGAARMQGDGKFDRRPHEPGHERGSRDGRGSGRHDRSARSGPRPSPRRGRRSRTPPPGRA